ncbi:MAG: hypothetical protein L0Z50_37075, partial [Verrucomicrobiales bacterium]|nr:hypothetical protein [Verrucomicrobiales bacterium]
QWAIKDVARFDMYLTNRPFSDVTGMIPVRSVPAETVSTTLTGLPTLQDHFIAIVAIDALGKYDPLVTYSAAYILSPQVISREVSLFVGNEPQPPYQQAISRELSIVVATPEPPAPVGDVVMTVSPTGETVTLNWNSYNQWRELDVGYYNIYLSNRSFTNVSGMTPYAVVPGEQLATTFNGLPAWRDHFFAVVPVDAAGNFNPAVTYSAAYVLSPQVISREVSLFVGDEPPSPYREAISREVSFLVSDPAVPAPVTGTDSGFLAASATSVDGAIDLDWNRYNELLQRDVVRYRVDVTTSFFDNVSALPPFSYLTDGTQRHLLTGPTFLGVFTNRSVLRRIVCSRADQALGQDATVIFTAVSNVDYLVMVGQIGAGSSKVRLSYRGAEEFRDFIGPISVVGGHLQGCMLVTPGKYEWSWGSDAATWMPTFQTNVASGLFQYNERLDRDTPVRLFRLLPAK